MSNCHNPTQLNPKLGRPYFPKKPNHNQKPKPTPTFSQLLHNQTWPNSGYNLISTQLEDSCNRPPSQKKIGQNCFCHESSSWLEIRLHTEFGQVWLCRSWEKVGYGFGFVVCGLHRKTRLIYKDVKTISC